jgi:hypothetical protein
MIQRRWKQENGKRGKKKFVEINEDRASRDLANAHGNQAIEKLKELKKLETHFAEYRYVD